MSKEELYFMLERLFTKEALPPETVIDINNAFIAATPQDRVELENDLEEYFRNYIKQNSMFATIPAKELVRMDLTTVMEQLLAKKEAITNIINQDPEQTDTKNDIVHLINRIFILGCSEETALIRQREEELAPYLKKNKGLQAILAFKIGMLETHRIQTKIQEEQLASIYRNDFLEYQYHNKSISESEYIFLRDKEETYMAYLNLMMDFSDINLNYYFYSANNILSYEILGKNISPAQIQHESELKDKADWIECDVQIAYANWKFACAELTEEERAEIIGSALITQAEVESRREERIQSAKRKSRFDKH